jgi:hypothetical protein
VYSTSLESIRRHRTLHRGFGGGVNELRDLKTTELGCGRGARSGGHGRFGGRGIAGMALKSTDAAA